MSGVAAKEEQDVTRRELIQAAFAASETSAEAAVGVCILQGNDDATGEEPQPSSANRKATAEQPGTSVPLAAAAGVCLLAALISGLTAAGAFSGWSDDPLPRLAVLLLIIGLLLLVGTVPLDGVVGEKNEEYDAKFKFTLLDKVLQADERALDELLAAHTRKLPKDVAQLFDQKKELLDDEREKELLRQDEALKASIQPQIEEATSARELTMARRSIQKRVFVIVPGDVNTQEALDDLSAQVNFLVRVATPNDEVVVNVTNPGGLVIYQGLAASQLLRIRDAGVQLTVCVDAVAASGGLGATGLTM